MFQRLFKTEHNTRRNTKLIFLSQTHYTTSNMSNINSEIVDENNNENITNSILEENITLKLSLTPTYIQQPCITSMIRK